MSFFDKLLSRNKQPVFAVNSMAGETAVFYDMNDPRLLEFLRNGNETPSGITVTPQKALKNTTILRCVSLISFGIGMLPLHLQFKEDKSKAKDHKLYKILHRKPNNWQTAFEFRSLMEQRALTHGNAYAFKVGGVGGLSQLVPLHPDKITPKQNPDWSLSYIYDGPTGRKTLDQKDIFHLRYGISDDGISGNSLVMHAADSIGLALQTDVAAGKLFKNGSLVGNVLMHPDKLSDGAFKRLQESLKSKEGAENAYKTMILEEGIKLDNKGQSGTENQHLETRKHQVEDISRAFGVPRPLLNVDDTTWGSGVAELGQLFVRYSLNPWFEAWQQAIERDLLTDAEQEIYEPKFNAGALLRGSFKEQAEFFAKGLGAGGHAPFLEVDEVRGWIDLPHSDNLPERAMKSKGESDELETASKN